MTRARLHDADAEGKVETDLVFAVGRQKQQSAKSKSIHQLPNLEWATRDPRKKHSYRVLNEHFAKRAKGEMGLLP